MKHIYNISILILLTIICISNSNAQNLSKGSGTETDPYLIESATDWNTFAANVNADNTFSGKTVKLAANISVTTMIGSGNDEPNTDNKSSFKYFAGTFDGGGYTLDINITGIGKNVAPFRYVDGATFNNVRVTGVINAETYQRAASIVGWCWGNCTLNKCHSDVTINSDISGNGSHGGLVAASDVIGNVLSLNYCVFSGTLNAPNATNCGGLLGWCYRGNGTVYMDNCLVSGKLIFNTDNSTGYFYQVAQGNGEGNGYYLTDCYYVKSKGLDQGTEVCTTQPDEYAQKVTLVDGNDYYIPAKPYAVYENEWKTLAFYYSADVPPDAMFLKTTETSPAWYSKRTQITKVFFDESFKNAKPVSCYMWFYQFTQLNEITNIENLNTENVTSMSYTFSNCSVITSLDLRNFNTAKVTNMDCMFNGCTYLTTILVGDNWSTAKVNNSDFEMFMDCTSLVGGAGTKYDANHTNIEYARVDGGKDSPGYLTRNYAIIHSEDFTATKGNPPTTITQTSAGTPVTLKYTGSKDIVRVELVALPTRIWILPETLMLSVGDESTISCEIYPDIAKDKTVKWSVDDESVVEITPHATEPDKAIVKAKATGVAKITVTTNTNNKSNYIIVMVE